MLFDYWLALKNYTFTGLCLRKLMGDVLTGPTCYPNDDLILQIKFLAS